MTYKDFIIEPTYPQPPIPTRKFDWGWRHEETGNDGPDCLGWGHAGNVEQCKDAIDEWHLDQEDAAT